MAERAAHGVEKHQVSRLEFLFGNGLGGSGLLGSPARQDAAQRFFERSPNKTAAIKTGFRRRASVTIAHTQKTHGIAHQLGGRRQHAVSGLLDLTDDIVLAQERLKVVVGGGGLGVGHTQGDEAECEQQLFHGAAVYSRPISKLHEKRKSAAFSSSFLFQNQNTN